MQAAKKGKQPMALSSYKAWLPQQKPAMQDSPNGKTVALS